MTQGIEDTIAEVVDLRFLAADTGVKQAFSRFIEMVLSDVVHYGLIGKLTYNSFDRGTESNILKNELAEKLHKSPNLTERDFEITNSKETKKELVEHGNIVEPRTQVEISSTASEDDSRTRRKNIRRQLGKRHQCKVENIKESLTFDFPHAVTTRLRVQILPVYPF